MTARARLLPALGAALALQACAEAPAGPPRPAPAPPPATASATAPLPEPPPPPVAYDLVIRGGRVIDPASGRDGRFDIAVQGDHIAKIDPSIDASRASRVLDATGLIVTPGLLDLHTHVFAGTTGSYLSESTLAVMPDDFAPASCTTTVVDAGSAGHRTFARFKAKIVLPSRTRVLAFVNIVGEGMRGGAYEQKLADMDAEATGRLIEAERDILVGVKVAHYAGRGFEPIDRAVAATRAGGRVMVDFGEHKPPLSLEELFLRRLRPGDIFTHMYADVPGRTALVDDKGMLRPEVVRARERGILFDLGYGGASFVFSQAEPAIRQGFLPDTVSTDTHRTSRRGSMGSLLNVLSKLEALGMRLPDLIARTTKMPADAIDRPALGRLAEGGVADIAILAEEKGTFDFTDTRKGKITGTTRLSCAMTVRAGEVLWERAGKQAVPAVEGSLCPADMIEIQGEYCTKVEETCLKKRNPRQCAEFEQPTRCVGPSVSKHYCVDRYEWPNQKGALATVMVSWEEARTRCEAIGKRLCTDAEWTLACEGNERWPFPYGYTRDSVACAIDKPSPKVNEARLFSPRTQDAELARLDQREPSGARERCVSPFGVRDLTGNVDEWVVNERGVPYASALKGGNWGEYRNACRPTTLGHAEGFRYYQIGYRCCRSLEEGP
ncbi:MAG: amidohydrolase/deacetylase family metallohydrolase [Byssovorax sp.]